MTIAHTMATGSTGNGVMRFPARKIEGFLCIMTMAIQNIACAASNAGGITIVTPENDVTVNSGASISVVIQVDPSLEPESVAVFTSNAQVPHLNFTSPPYEGALQIPNNFTGTFEITAIVRTPSMDVIKGPRIKINVVPGESPARIEVESTKRIGFPEEGPRGEREIGVFGIYDNDVRRPISSSRYGTTYASSNPSVVTVGAEGVLTSVAPGVAYITISNGGKTAVTQVKVSDSTTGAYPTQECTGQATVTASGFRRDPESGLFIQQLTVRSTGNLPLPKPVNVVIQNLPEGVRMENSFGKARSVAGVIAHVDVKEQDFLPPGSTAVATLKFSNREGVPITYTRKLYCGRRP